MTNAMRWMWVVLLSGACGSDLREPAAMEMVEEPPEDDATLPANAVRLPTRQHAAPEPTDVCALVLVAGDGQERYVREALLERGDDGFVRNADGFMLAGYAVDGYGHASRVHAPLALLDELAPLVTTTIGVRINLNGSEDILAAFDPLKPFETSNFSSGSRLFDAQGAPHDLTIYFRKERAQVWSWHANLNFRSDYPFTTENARGTLQFDRSGVLVDQAYDFSAFAIGQGGAQLPVHFDFAGSTGSLGPSSTNATAYDGRPGASVFEEDVDAQGVVRALTSLGTREPVGTLAFALGDERDGYEVLPVDSATCALSRSLVDDGVFDLRAELVD